MLQNCFRQCWARCRPSFYRALKMSTADQFLNELEKNLYGLSYEKEAIQKISDTKPPNCKSKGSAWQKDCDTYQKAALILFILKDKPNIQKDFRSKMLKWMQDTFTWRVEVPGLLTSLANAVGFGQDHAKRSLRHNLRQDFLTR